MSAPGRNCPLRYRYGADAVAHAPERLAQTLYVIGGLYGNAQALRAIEDMAGAERGPVTLCFNGDFNWFNVDDAGFSEVNASVLQHDCILGNVEAELAPEAGDAGCGCAYPESVSADTVERSNAIHARLKRTATRHPEVLRRIAALPMVARYRVGTVRIGVVHGDAEALAGWRFDAASLDDPDLRDWRAYAFAQSGVDVFASSHTCLPALRGYASKGCKLVINNGAAGMPNFRGQRHGILTRIATTPTPHPRLYGSSVRGVHVDALAIRYDPVLWQAAFLANWPAGSPAWLSYFERIDQGPVYSTLQACGKRAA